MVFQDPAHPPHSHLRRHTHEGDGLVPHWQKKEGNWEEGRQENLERNRVKGLSQFIHKGKAERMFPKFACHPL